MIELGLSELFPCMIGAVIFVLGIVALVRILKKVKHGETINIEPVGVFKDLPDTVTGLQNGENPREKVEKE